MSKYKKMRLKNFLLLLLLHPITPSLTPKRILFFNELKPIEDAKYSSRFMLTVIKEAKAVAKKEKKRDAAISAARQIIKKRDAVIKMF